MASSKIFYSVLLGYFLLMSSLVFFGTSIRSHLAEDDKSSADLISKTCSHTLYYEICVFSLKSDPRSETADVQGLADIALSVSIAYGEETLAHVTDLKSKATENETLSSCLGDCVQEYNDAVGDLQEAADALKVKSLENVKTLVSSAMTDSDTCEEGFKEMELGDGSPLADRSQYFSKLCSNLLAITHLLS
ncbi:putative invertase inhibitor [Ricinus communis]|uniref:Pectinmethylesterase inhibitor 2, putative n=1 Tax=Ricinus communis TaxID=3988 RepID=B9RR26_RICCO|nr:putative invertase inhibitor [Ricinus communis]EEF46197.1 Pectinmethylesterase inhibitor 2 precursor, putative [Ricinus communis]|eukprot:XP_002516195.1 putative invertase inhibitor [Ricinus communis]